MQRKQKTTVMKDFKLIDSVYDAQESKSVLLSLIADKVRFLNTKSLRKRECEGEPCTHSELRVSMLRDESVELQTILDDPKNADKHYQVECVVTVKEVVAEKASSTEKA